MADSVSILFPTGRLVMGSLYKPQDKDAEGRPLVIKNGPQAGQPRVDYFFALAIAKGAEPHWAHTAWGAEVWKNGHAFSPNAGQFPGFAWKIVDGDSAIPNKKGKKPCDREGYRGHWVVTFSGGFVPKVYQIPPGAKDPVIWPQPDAVNLGDYIEVYGNCQGNGSASQPGVFINHSMVCFRGYGERIVLGPDATAVGFGGSAVPAGATAVPSGTAMPPPPGAAAAPTPPVAAAPVPPAALPPAPSIPAANIPPHLPVPPAAAPPVPAAPTTPQLTPKAGTTTYAQFIAGGWTDELLRREGYMI